MGYFSDAGNYISLQASKALDRVFPARVQRTAPQPFPPSTTTQQSPPPSPGLSYGVNPSAPRPNIQVIQDWIVPSTLGWTLDAMQSAILQLENGNLYAAHSLMLAMTRDATVGHGLMVRRMSLSALDAKLWFPPSIPEEAREALRKHWPEAITSQDKATAHSYTVMLGLAPMTQLWFEKTEPAGETYWQFRSEVLESGHLQFRPDLRRYFFIARDGYREIVDDGNAWALFKSLGDRRHHLDSAVRALATLWFIVQEAVRYHRAYNAEYGRPIKGLMVPDSHRLTEDVAQLVSQASGLYGGSVIILPQFGEGQGTANFDLKLIEAKSRGFQTFSDLAKTARNLITLYLVGVLETTGGESASNAKATTQLKVADRYTIGDAKVEMDALNRPLRRWADFNGFDEAPEWRIKTDPPEDDAVKAAVAKDRAAALKSTADALKSMYDMGVRVTEERVTSTLAQVGFKWSDRGVAEALSPYLYQGVAGQERLEGSVLVCWEVPEEIGSLLAVAGGEALEELHVTLACCPGGSVPDVIAGMVAVVGSLAQADGYVSGVASWPAGGPQVNEAEAVLPEREAQQVPEADDVGDLGDVINGQTAVKGRLVTSPQGQTDPSQPAKPKSKQLFEVFRPTSDIGQLAYVSLVDCPALYAMREQIVKALTAAGVKVTDNHGFIPHITRAYLPAGSGVEAPGLPLAMRIDKLSVWALGGRVRIPMRIGQPEIEELQLCADHDLDDEIVELTTVLNNPKLIELRTYQRGFGGRFGHGTGTAKAKESKAPRVTGKAAAAHSDKAHAEKTVEAHRYAARAHVAVARREIQKGNIEKAKRHLETAKEHRDSARGLKIGAKSEVAKPKTEAKTEPKMAPSSKAKAETASTKAAEATAKAHASNDKADHAAAKVAHAEAAKAWHDHGQTPGATLADVNKEHPHTAAAKLHGKTAKDGVKAAVEAKPLTDPAKFEKDHYDSWQKGLSTTKPPPSGEHGAVVEYTGSAYSAINGALRSETKPSKEHANVIKGLDKALNKTSAPEAFTAYRTMSSSMLDKLKVGQTFQDKGFMSTTMAKGAFDGGNILMSIAVPKGAKGGAISGLSKFPNEKEFLLPRGSKLRIHSITKVGNEHHVQASYE